MILTISFVFSRIAQKDTPSCVCTKQYFLPSRSGKIRINLSINQENGKENPFVSDGLYGYDGRERMKSNHAHAVQDGKGGGDGVFRRVVK